MLSMVFASSLFIETKIIILGLAKDVAQRVYGSIWTIMFYKDKELWGFYLKCREHPQFNLWHSFVIGEESCIDNELLGGNIRVI